MSDSDKYRHLHLQLETYLYPHLSEPYEGSGSYSHVVYAVGSSVAATIVSIAEAVASQTPKNFLEIFENSIAAAKPQDSFPERTRGEILHLAGIALGVHTEIEPMQENLIKYFEKMSGDNSIRRPIRTSIGFTLAQFMEVYSPSVMQWRKNNDDLADVLSFSFNPDAVDWNA